jgi:hypothetical protein
MMDYLNYLLSFLNTRNIPFTLLLSFVSLLVAIVARFNSKEKPKLILRKEKGIFYIENIWNLTLNNSKIIISDIGFSDSQMRNIWRTNHDWGWAPNDHAFDCINELEEVKQNSVSLRIPTIHPWESIEFNKYILWRKTIDRAIIKGRKAIVSSVNKGFYEAESHYKDYEQDEDIPSDEEVLKERENKMRVKEMENEVNEFIISSILELELTIYKTFWWIKYYKSVIYRRE